jgi:two-component system cell cycle sensor histidine kinase/response regulator CckA
MAPMRRHAEEILKAVDRASNLTRQLLTFGRKQVIEPRFVNLNVLVANVETMLRQLIGKDISFNNNLAPHLGWVKADPSQIEQVVLNLAVNARDAMPEGGKLTIETANIEIDDPFKYHVPDICPGRYVMLSVTDTGIGIDQETQTKMFEPFFTTKAPGKGTGLGLSIIYGIVKQNHGHVAVSSVVGHGATFTIYLPQVEALAPISSSIEHPPVAYRGSETILVVEDEEQIRSLECRILQSNGYKILAAKDGIEALLICREYSEPIHLLITDIAIPPMNGQDLAHHTTSLRPMMQVLYLSGCGYDTDISSAKSVNSSAFLQKPFSSETLLCCVRQALDKQNKL